MGRLHRAARLGKTDEVGECLFDGADVNALSVHNFSALMLAAQEGHLSVVVLLLDAGADTGLCHPNGRTALHFAACKGNLAVVEALATHGARLDALSRIGCTPALEAAQFNHRKVVEFLRKHGADMTFKDREGLAADDWLMRGGIQGWFKERFPASLWTCPEMTERAENHIREFMAGGLSADEYAAKYGRRTLVWSYGIYEFDDENVQRWARRVSEVLFTPGLLDECEERFLQGEELEDARKYRERRARAVARRKKREAGARKTSEP